MCLPGAFPGPWITRLLLCDCAAVPALGLPAILLVAHSRERCPCHLGKHPLRLVLWSAHIDERNEDDIASPMEGRLRRTRCDSQTRPGLPRAYRMMRADYRSVLSLTSSTWLLQNSTPKNTVPCLWEGAHSGPQVWASAPAEILAHHCLQGASEQSCWQGPCCCLLWPSLGQAQTAAGPSGLQLPDQAPGALA